MSSTHVFLTLVLASGCCMWTTQVSAIQFNFNFNFKQWMPMHSRPQPSQCKDLKDTCPEWVYFGFCDNPEYETYMTIYCNKSCNMCTGGNRVIQPRIIRGDEAARGEYPYMASLQECKYGSCTLETSFRHVCGGTLIARNWVLTAAHCVDEDPDVQERRVLLGTNKLSRPLEQQGQTVRVGQIKRHPEYEDGRENDIALLELTSAADINEYVKVAELAPTGYDVDGSDCILTGWGKIRVNPDQFPDNLKELIMTVKPNSQCRRFKPTQICAQATYTPSSSSSCKGDSGGPLMCGRYLSGVVSQSHCQGGYPTRFTRVSAFREWIDDNMH